MDETALYAQVVIAHRFLSIIVNHAGQSSINQSGLAIDISPYTKLAN
jgi:hypothetical protein